MTQDKTSVERALPCPFCGSEPTFGLTKRTGCQLHGDPIQYVLLGCRNDKCRVNPGVTGGDRYAHGETGKFFEHGERAAKELAIKYWNDRPPSPQKGNANE